MNTANLNDERAVGNSSVPERPGPLLEPAKTPDHLRAPEVAEADGKTRDSRSEERPATPENKTKRHVIIGVATMVASVALGAYYFTFVAPFESTDNAFIEGHVTSVAPQIAGRVDKLLVGDNQFVSAGDALVQIEPSDYEAKLEQVRANLASARSRFAQAKAQFTVDQAKVEQEKANVIAAQAEAMRAETDSKRYQAIGASGVSQSQIDLAATQARSASANATVARNKQLAAEAQITLDQASIETAEADAKSAEAAVRQAELDLSYTKIKAKESGYVTRRSVEAGAYVQPGQALLAIVPKAVWVVANFKETQLKHMRPGPPVTVHVDAYPQLKFTGHVDSVQAGTGARFSLLPAENASGNFVKVVQRVPVKIVLDDAGGHGVVLGAGMSQREKTRYRGESIGFVFQAYNLIPTLTAAENASVPLLVRGEKRRKANVRAREVLQKVGFDERMMHSLPAQLSGGQQQRVAIARALVHNPKLIVCDEPTAALDHETGQTIMELLRSVALHEGRALIVVTHDARIFGFGDRFAKLDDGHVERVVNSPAELNGNKK